MGHFFKSIGFVVTALALGVALSYAVPVKNAADYVHDLYPFNQLNRIEIVFNEATNR